MIEFELNGKKKMGVYQPDQYDEVFVQITDRSGIRVLDEYSISAAEFVEMLNDYRLKKGGER